MLVKLLNFYFTKVTKINKAIFLIHILGILELVVKHELKSVSIPGISTGVFSFPIHKAAAIISSTIREYIDENPGRMAGKEIIFCNFDDETVGGLVNCLD